MKESKLEQYSGKWRVFEDTEWYDGILYVDHDKRYLELVVTIPCEDKNPMPRLPYVGHVQYVNGILQNGAKALLYDCSIGFENAHVFQYSQQSVYPECCFIGLTADNEQDIRFSKVVFDFGEIINWSTLCEYKWELKDGGDTTIKWESQPDIEFCLRENVKVAFRPQLGHVLFSSTKVETTVDQHVIVEFQYVKPQEWSVIINDALSIRYFIGLGMNRYIGIEQAYYYHANHVETFTSENGEVERPYPMEVWFGDTDGVHTTEGKPYEYAYTLGDCKEAEVFKRWSIIYPKLKPVLDLYFTSARYNVRVPEIIFLNLMQALETYHARFIADTKADYIKHVDQMLQEVYKGDGKEAAIEWRKKLVSPAQENHDCNTVYLRSRLQDLVFADGVICWWQFNNGKNEDFITKLVDSRNYYTHYDEKKKDKAYTKDELVFVDRHLLCLLKYHLLTQIGFDKQKTYEKTVDERGRINDGYWFYSQTHKVTNPGSSIQNN